MHINSRLRVKYMQTVVRCLRKMLVVVFLAIICCVMFVAWSWMRPNSRAPPALPGALPVIGHSHQLFGDRKRLWDFVKHIQLYSLTHGGVIKFWLGHHSYYVLTDPDDSLTVSNICLSKPYIYEFAKDFLNNGLITANASIWKNHRKLLNPAFNQQVLNTYVEEINVQARSLVALLDSMGKEPFDPRNCFISYALSTVTRTSLRLNTKDQNTITTDYAAAIQHLLEIYCDRAQKVWLHLTYLYNRSSMKQRQSQLVKILNDIINPLIYKRKTELKASKDRDTYNGQDKFKPVLDHMLHLAEEQDAFTDDEIREHLDTFVAAAYDTTSSSLTLILLIIGKYKDVQEKIYKEIQEVVGDSEEDLTKDDLQKLVYLEAVIKESMRLYPSVPFVARKIDTNVKLKNYDLRAGNSCIIGIYGLLRHSMWGPDAEEFKPERWLDPTSLPKHPCIYAYYGVGKRNCIGKLFSVMMMKTALAHVFRRYSVSGDISKVVCEFDVVLRPVEGHHISLKSRK